jgi:PiT family inorganic phosphate transporter
MTIETTLVSALVLMLAWANGANDISKGVATLVGNGTARARRAVWWGTLWTCLGGLAAVAWGTALLHTFGGGYLRAGFPITPEFVASTVAAAATWVIIATRTGLPVSTTHALLGGIVGAALAAAGPEALRATIVANKAMVPLLASPLIAVGLSAMFLMLARAVAKRVPAWRPGCCARETWLKNPFACAVPSDGHPASRWAERIWIGLHWLSSGATSFARGLNDVPKISAFLVLAVAMAPSHTYGTGSNAAWPILTVTLAMAFGSLWGGFKVLNILSHRITPLDANSGVVANVGTSALVLAASLFGLPVSTTHISAGALMGVRWTDKVKPAGTDALKLVLAGWAVTFPAAALFAAVTFRILGWM